MSEQPLFDVKALREIDAQPGDVFTLELPQDDYEVLTPELKQRLRSELSQQMNGASVLLLKPGMRLEKMPPAVISYQEASDVTPERLKELEAAIRKAYAENPPQAMMLPPANAVQWRGNMPSVVRTEEPAPSLKEANEKHAAETAGIVKKPLAQLGEQGGYAIPREVALHAVESGVLPPNAVVGSPVPMEQYVVRSPIMRYLRPVTGGRLQGSNDMKTWVDLDPATLKPVEAQADEPVVIERKDGE